MARLEHSPGALDTLKRFHKSQYVVYVEGFTDVPFWKQILTMWGLENIHVTPAGGSATAKQYVSNVIERDTNIVVALDSDFSEVVGERQQHPRVLFTYGHSLENSLYCPGVLSNVISALACTGKDYHQAVNDWRIDFGKRSEPILILAIANYISKKGISVFGANCCRLLPSSGNPLLCPERISAEAQTLREHFCDAEIEQARAALDRYPKNVFWAVKGHFATQGAINLTKKFVALSDRKKLQFSEDSFRVMALGYFRRDTMDQEDAQHLSEQINRLVQSYSR